MRPVAQKDARGTMPGAAEEGQKAPTNGNPELTREIEPGGTPKLISSNVVQSDEKEHFTEGCPKGLINNNWCF
jgi:hypothetical protein